MYDYKSNDVFSYYLKNKIHEIHPEDFDWIETILDKLKTYNDKLNNCGKHYKKNDTILTILVE